MKAAWYENKGPAAQVLRLGELPDPVPAAGEVRVRVLAAGVSLPDVMMREGIHPETPALPFTPGWDLVGEVDRLGDGVSGFEPGDRVAALPIHGAYAQFICLPQKELVPVPAGLNPAEAVSLIPRNDGVAAPEKQDQDNREELT